MEQGVKKSKKDYRCPRCLFGTDKKWPMINHMNRKIVCEATNLI